MPSKSYRSLLWMTALCAIWLSNPDRLFAGILLTADNATVNAGDEATITVRWTGTDAINFLNTEFVLTIVTGPSAGVSFKTDGSGDPSIPPPLTDSQYLFYGNSFSGTLGSNPATLQSSNWTNDTLLMTDTTSDFNDVTPNGNQLWISFTVITSPTASGTYRISLGPNSAYDNSTNFVNNNPPFQISDSDFSGGVITVNSVNSTVPEPSMLVVGCTLFGAFGLRRLRRRSSLYRDPSDN